MTKYPFEFNDQKPSSESSPTTASQDQAAASPSHPIEVDPTLGAGTIDSHIEPPPAKDAKDDYAVLEARLKEREDQLIRLAAEVENMRKRHAQELASASKFAIEGFAESLLPVGDSLEMALQLPNQTLEGLTNGVNITRKQLQQAFEKGRLSVVNPVGEKFDPNRHQAVSMVDGKTQDPPVASGHVVTVMQKGYLIGDRVLRPALVAVAQ